MEMELKAFYNKAGKISVELKLCGMDRKSNYTRTSNGKLFLQVTVHLLRAVEKLLLCC